MSNSLPSGDTSVLLVEHWSSGGTAYYAAQLAASLGAIGSLGEVRLLVPQGFPSPSPQGVQTLRLLPSQGMSSKSRSKNGVRLLRRRWSLERVIVKKVRELRPAILHLLGTTHVARDVLRAAHSTGSAVFVTVHDVPRSNILQDRMLGAGVEQLRGVQGLFVHGEHSRRAVQSSLGFGCPPVTEIPFGAFYFGPPTAGQPVLRQRYELPMDRVVVLFFGSLRAGKGLFRLLEALATLPSDSLHLFVVGHSAGQREPSPSAYQRRANELGLTGAVSWKIGYVSDEEVADVFSAADWVALPYSAGFNAQSAVLSTALAYRRPVVASDVGEIGPAVRALRCGYVCEAGSREALVDALRRALSESAPILGGHNASWQAVAQATLSFYRSVRGNGAV